MNKTNDITYTHVHKTEATTSNMMPSTKFMQLIKQFIRLLIG